MQAQVVHDLGGVEQLSFEPIADPTPDRGQVVIGVEAVGLNFPDLLMIQGLYPIPARPAVRTRGRGSRDRAGRRGRR